MQHTTEKNKYNKMHKERKFKRTSLCAQGDRNVSKSSNESSSEDGTSEFIVMILEELENDFHEYGEEQEGEEDFWGELMSALDEIERIKLNNRKKKKRSYINM